MNQKNDKRLEELIDVASRDAATARSLIMELAELAISEPDPVIVKFDPGMVRRRRRRPWPAEERGSDDG
jgi:hypothetical protein